MKIFLSYNQFNILNPTTWLGVFIRLVTYFKRKGQHDKVKWHHCGVIKDGEVWEALITFQRHRRGLGEYENVVILKPNFEFNEEIFFRVLNEEIGKVYGFWAIVCMFIFQISGKKIQKDFRCHVCSNSIAKAFYFSCDENYKVYFKNHAYTDPQDFVRLWKVNNLFEYATKNN